MLNPSKGIYDIDTGDQGFCWVQLDLSKMAELFRQYNLPWNPNYLDRICVGEWSDHIQNDILSQVRSGDNDVFKLQQLLSSSPNLRDEELVEICEENKLRNDQGIKEFYEDVFLSKYMKASNRAKSVLLNRHGYDAKKIYKLLIENMNNPEKIESFNNYVSMLYHWGSRLKPDIQVLWKAIEMIDQYETELKLYPTQWAILLLNYKDRNIYKQLIEKLNRCKRVCTKVVCMETLSWYCHWNNDLLISFKKKKVLQEFIKLIKAKDKMEKELCMPFFLFMNWYSIDLKFKKVYEIYKEIQASLWFQEEASMMELLNRKMHIEGYNSIIEKDYLKFLEDHPYCADVVIKGVVLSKDPEMLKLCDSYRDSKNESVQKALSFNKAKALEAYEEVRQIIVKTKGKIN